MTSQQPSTDSVQDKDKDQPEQKRVEGICESLQTLTVKVPQVLIPAGSESDSEGFESSDEEVDTEWPTLESEVASFFDRRK